MPGIRCFLVCLCFITAPAGAQPPVAEPVWSVVTVLPGDSLQSIADQHGVSTDELRRENPGLSEPVKTGDRLRVFSPVRAEEHFRIQIRGRDWMSLRWLSKKYDVPVRLILRLNGWRTSHRIKDKERIKLYVPRSRWPGGNLDGGVQLQDSPGVKVKHPKWAWGRPVAVRLLEQVGRLVAERYPESLVVVGDLSRRYGGRFPPHAGHKTGLDVDLGLFRKGEPWRFRFRDVKPEDLDAERTWFLIESLLATGLVERILVDWRLQEVLYAEAVRTGWNEDDLDLVFQYPRKRWKSEGLIRHWKGHRNHLHIRFREPDPSEGRPFL